MSPQPIVAEGIRVILGRSAQAVEIVPMDPAAVEPDVVLYDVVKLLDGDATELDVLDADVARGRGEVVGVAVRRAEEHEAG